MEPDDSLKMQRRPPVKSNTCAVVVTYYPDSEFSSRLNAVAHQVGAVVIIDNCSGYRTEMLKQAAELAGAQVIWNSENRGVATALRQGLRWASERGFAWLLTMDQDTIISDSAISVFEQVVMSASEDKIAVIGSNSTDKLTGLPMMASRSFGNCIAKNVKTVITSGSIVSIEATQVIGDFREDFFIDHLDDEYCLRACRMGYRILITRAPLIKHSVGNPQWHFFLRKKVKSPHMAAQRQYYMSRNLVTLIKNYWRYEPWWLGCAIKWQLKYIALFLVFEDQKQSKLRYAFRGIVDGILGKMGPIKKFTMLGN